MDKTSIDKQPAAHWRRSYKGGTARPPNKRDAALQERLERSRYRAEKELALRAEGRDDSGAEMVIPPGVKRTEAKKLPDHRYVATGPVEKVFSGQAFGTYSGESSRWAIAASTSRSRT